MATLNQVNLLGNLTRDPELKYTPKGKAVCQFGLAVNESWKDADGAKREDVMFVDVEAWGAIAEVLAKHMSKGRSILIVGRLKLDTWETKEGDKRSKHKIVLESFQFIGGKKDGAE